MNHRFGLFHPRGCRSVGCGHRPGAAAALLLLLQLGACQPSGVPGDSAGEASAPRARGTTPGVPVAYLSGPDGETLDLPFSEAVRVGDMLYLAGQVGNRPGEMAVVPGGLVPETRQTMENIRAVLQRHGSGLDRVVKCTVMIEDIGQWGAFNEVYVEYFPGPKPARSAFGADGLALGAAVEVECWATVDLDRGS